MLKGKKFDAFTLDEGASQTYDTPSFCFWG